jgi:hypothetical protein
MNMVETIKNLHNDVQMHKDDNERIMQYKELQEELNMKLMNIFDIIGNKLDKENGSSKCWSHRSPDEKGITRSANRHHHHSTRNSNRREHNK